MKFDLSLITGIFLGVTVGLVYTGQLVAYLPFFVIGAVILILRYLHAVR
ncbi:MAG: hypothetical protein HYU34_05945 [Candidatus Omnitrophica bacterium]|nr:hypothetical protein [Candidatus Omnitrophota bacterium]